MSESAEMRDLVERLVDGVERIAAALEHGVIPMGPADLVSPKDHPFEHEPAHDEPGEPTRYCWCGWDEHVHDPPKSPTAGPPPP